MVVRLDEKALARHLYVLGGTGVGKSRAIEAWALELIRRDQGIGVIDPHGELYQNLVARIAKQGRRLYEQVVLFNPLDPVHAVGFNPLELKSGEVAERKAQFLASVITKIFQADPLITARMQRILFHTFWLLIRSKLTLLEFEQVLTDRGYRARLLAPLSGFDGLQRYWEREFPEQDRLVTEWTQSALNKVGPLVTDPDFRLILGQQRSTLDFRAIMDAGKVLLVNLPKGQLGEAGSHLMGAFVLAQIQQAALSRAENPHSVFRPFTLFVDEFQNYTSDDIHTILAESRKYKLALVMAHQYYDQLRDHPKLQAAVLETVGNLAVFRVGADDAERLVKDLFTPALDEVKDVRVRKLPTGIQWWPYTTERDAVYRPLEEIWERETRHLTELPERTFWYKRRGTSDAVRLHTANMPDVVMTPQLQAAIAQLTTLSGQLYGRSKAAVRAEIAQRRSSNTENEDDLPPFGV